MSLELDLNNLEDNIINGISFRGDKILAWCKNNLNSNDENKKYAAKEIYRNYFITAGNRALKSNKYYYITYGNAFHVGHLYSIFRDLVLSPKFKSNKNPTMKNILSMIDSINNIKLQIQSKTTEFDNDINKSEQLCNHRLKCIGIRGKKGIKYSYYSAGNYKKYQIYKIIEEHLLDMKALKYIIKQINRDTA